MRWNIQPARALNHPPAVTAAGVAYRALSAPNMNGSSPADKMVARAASAGLLIAVRGEGESLEYELPIVGVPVIRPGTENSSVIWFTVQGYSATLRLSQEQQPDATNLRQAANARTAVAVVRGTTAGEVEQCDRCQEQDIRTDQLDRLGPLNVRLGCSRLPGRMFSHLQERAYLQTCDLTHDCIPFAYPDFGCEARAHRACHLLSQQPEWAGYLFKVCCVRGDTSPVCTKNHPHGKVIWSYHIAPAIKIDAAPAAPQTMVLDPSLFDTPMPLQVWVRRVLNGVAQVALHKMPAWAVSEKGDGWWWRDDSLAWGDAELTCQRLNLELRARCKKNGWPPYSNIVCP